MLLLRVKLTYEGEKQDAYQDWTYAAISMMELIDHCVRDPLVHHAHSCYSEGHLRQRLLFLPSRHKPPKSSTILMLMHRCVSCRLHITVVL
jgi:hypothetical protein